MQQNDYKNSYIKANQAYQISLKYVGESNLLTLCSIQQIGRIYLFSGDIVKAENTIEQTYKMFQKYRGENDEYTLDESTDYTSLLIQKRDYQKAIEIGEMVLEKWNQKNLSKDNQTYALILSNLGMAYNKQTYNYKKAIEYYEKSLEVKKKILGENSPFVVNAKIDLAHAYDWADNKPKATEILESVIQNNNEESNGDLERAYINLSVCYSAADKYDKALAILKKSGKHRT
ncbi:MAG: hypothetical protein EBR40_07000 [Proteobacteria bacterium]|nr:hypothetical protein [Pseudomonadota bacterium]